MVDVATLSVKVDTTDLARAEAALEALTKEGRLTEAGLKRLGTSSRTMGTGVTQASNRLSQATSVNRNFGRQIQNSAFQVGDFAVQMAGGQRASLALAQQLPQLLGGFGVFGAVLGAAVAIGGALVPVLFDLSSGAEALSEKIEELDEAISNYVKAASLANMSTSELRKKFGSAADGLRSTISLLEQIEQSEAQAAIDGLAESLAGLLGTAGAGESRSGIAKFFDVNIFLAFTKAGREARAEARKLTSEFENAQQALADAEGDINAQIKATQRLLSVAELLADADGERSDAEKELIKTLAESVLQMGTLVGKTDEFEGGLSRSVSSAEKIARLLERAANANAVVFDPRAQGFDQARADFARAQAQFREEQEERDRASSRTTTGRAGGGAANKFAAELEALNKALMTERETVEAWRSENLALLEGYNDQELAMMGLHKDARLRIEEEYQERLGDLREKERASRVQSIAGAFSDVASLMETNSKKLFNIGKTAAIAEATINGYEAATEAWSKGMKIGGPPVAAAFTAASLVRTGALISSINSTSFGSGGGGGGASSAAAPAVNTSPRVALTLAGSENATYTKSQVRDLINAINEEVEGGAVVRLA